MRIRALAHPARHGYLRALRLPTPDVIEAILCIAWEDQSRDSRAIIYDTLETMTSALTPQMRGKLTLPEKIATINNFLFAEAGFSGNQQEYYHVNNSYFDQVVITKTGLPIMLSLLYIALAQRVGVICHGVAFPGHFMVQCSDGVHDPLVIDPFRGGRVWSMAECTAYLIQQGITTSLPDMLSPPTPYVIIGRVLRNLKGSYVAQSDFANAASAIERILILDPNSAPDVRDYGLVLGRLGLPHMALIYLERYAKLAPAASDIESVRHHAKILLGQVVS
jgi:regulator of sirC expression with transglutaminase-like and TPR domain